MDMEVCDCGHAPITQWGSGATGYGTAADGSTLCYQCCAREDLLSMRATGKAVLYLDESDPRNIRVTNWPGTLSFRVATIKHGRHNIACTRTDVWFRDSERATWHGVQYGHATELIHCTRLKG